MSLGVAAPGSSVANQFRIAPCLPKEQFGFSLFCQPLLGGRDQRKVRNQSGTRNTSDSGLLAGKGWRQMNEESDELFDALAAGIFRGEGTTVCTVIGWRRKTPTPRLTSSVRMCDRTSVEAVAKSPGWNSKVRLEARTRGHCSTGGFEWGTSVSGVNRVRNAILPWIAKGYLSGEKADQYFEAVAKFRRAREVFQPERPGHRGRERQIL